MLTRRSFVGLMAPLALQSCISRRAGLRPAAGFVMTVMGKVDAGRLGTALPHEHLFSTFGQDAVDKADYNVQELEATVLPFLQQAKASGCRTIVDCTAAYFGRRPDILKMLAQKSGLNILTNTGIYGAAEGRYIPGYAYAEEAETIAGRWVGEWQNGIEDTGVRPGFMKLGVNSGPLKAVDKKLIKAGAITHLATGLVIAVHTVNNVPAAFEQLDILAAAGVAPAAWIWTHAHAAANEPLIEAAKRGAWISFDGFRPEGEERFITGLQVLKKAGCLHRVLLSHDANAYPRNGAAPPTASLALFTQLLPALGKAGFTESDIHQVTVANPANAFAISVRRI